MDALNGSDLLGQKIAVDWAFVKGPHKDSKKRYVDFTRSQDPDLFD